MKSENDKISHLVEGYERLLEKTTQELKNLESSMQPKLQKAMDVAKNKAIEIGELSAEEAGKISEYIRKDLHDAADYITTEERNLADWLRLDLLRAKEYTVKEFTYLVDQAGLEIKHLAKQPRHSLAWHTGEITGIGTLECDECKELIHFHKAGHIPPCPKCTHTSFHRTLHK